MKKCRTNDCCNIPQKYQRYCIECHNKLRKCQNPECNNICKLINAKTYEKYCSRECVKRNYELNSITFKLKNTKAPKCQNPECIEIVSICKNGKYFNKYCYICREIMRKENLIKTNLKRYGVISTAMTISNKEKVKKTNLERYGTSAPTKNKEILEKVRSTTKSNYGVEHALQDANILTKFKNTIYKKYGVENYKQIHIDFNILEKINDIDNLKNLNKSMSIAEIAYKYKVDWNTIRRRFSENNILIKQHARTIIEKQIENILNENNILFKSQFYINRRSYDIRILNSNLLIEVHGDFWHANPLFYNKDEKMPYPSKTILAEEKWQYDADKKLLAENNGFKVFTIWENDIKTDLNKVKDQLLDIIRQSML